MAADAIEWRMRHLEDRHRALVEKVEHIDSHGSRKIGVIEERVSHLGEEIDHLAGEVASLRRAVIGASLSISASAVVFAFTVFTVLS